jgi:hypothetical protein
LLQDEVYSPNVLEHQTLLVKLPLKLTPSYRCRRRDLEPSKDLLTSLQAANHRFQPAVEKRLAEKVQIRAAVGGVDCPASER